MFRTERLIARHFWHTTLKNRAVFVLLIGIGAVAVYALWSGWATFRQQRDIRATYQQQARQDWLNNPDKHPHRMAHYGHFAFRPKVPLSVFDFGMESFMGSTIFLEAHKQNAVNFSEAGFSTGLLRFGEISPAMLLQILVPLLIFFLGFDSIATDRENGTLKLLLSQGVSWKQLLMGKSLGLMAVAGLLFVPVILLTGALWAVILAGHTSLDETLRLVLLVLTYLIYLTICCVVAVLVSAHSQTAKTALVSLIGLWLLLTIVLPRASQAVGSYVYALPSKAEFEARIQADIAREGDSHNPNDPHYKALKDSLLTAYGVDSVQQLPFNYSGLVMAEGEKISAAIYNRHFQNLLGTFSRQNRFARAMAFVNPYMAVKNLSMALAGTDYAGYLDFQQQAEQYRYAMAQKMNALQITYISNKKVAANTKDHTIDKKYWQEVPDFQYRPMAVSAVFESELMSFLAFGFWLVVLLEMIQISAKTLTPL